MVVTIIKDGDKSKQGNARCPQCDQVVLIENHWGDSPKCGGCGVPYRPIAQTPKFH